MTEELMERICIKVSADVFQERYRQITELGYTPENDDKYEKNELPTIASLYALHYMEGEWSNSEIKKYRDAVSKEFGLHFNPEPDPRKLLVKAAALILAEIERLDRKELQK